MYEDTEEVSSRYKTVFSDLAVRWTVQESAKTS
jgi:hypothetical protein